jgi:hypothetical protein
MKYKYITQTGEDAFSSPFDEASWFDVYGYAGVRVGRREFYINSKGEKVLETGHGLTMFDQYGLGLVHTNKKGIFSYGMLSVSGRMLIPIEHKGLGYLSHDLFCASSKKEDFCLNRDGKKVFGLGKFRLSDDDEFRHGRLLVVRNEQSYFVDTNGNSKLGPYWTAQMFCDGLAWVKFKENSSPVFINVDGEVVLTTEKFDYVSEYWHTVLQVKMNGKYGLINPSGHFLVEPVHERIESLWNGYFLLKTGRKRTVINNDAKTLFDLAPHIGELRYAEKETIVYQIKDQWGYMSLRDGSFITEALYQEAGPMRHGLAPVNE